MATYFVTQSETATWDDEPKNHLKTRPEADARARELLATSEFVRLLRYESGRVVREERLTSGADGVVVA
jgi:hypothetical protein